MPPTCAACKSVTLLFTGHVFTLQWVGSFVLEAAVWGWFWFCCVVFLAAPPPAVALFRFDVVSCVARRPCQTVLNFSRGAMGLQSAAATSVQAADSRGDIEARGEIIHASCMHGRERVRRRLDDDTPFENGGRTSGANAPRRQRIRSFERQFYTINLRHLSTDLTASHASRETRGHSHRACLRLTLQSAP